MSETMSLIVIPAANLPTILAADDKDILGKLAADLAEFEADVTTAKGRAEIASKAHKVATAKMDLIRLGKSLTEGWREQTKAVNAECKMIEERMDALRDQVRAPLDEYQDREKRRIESHERAIGDFTFLMETVAGMPSSAEVAEVLDIMETQHTDRNWEEFADKAIKARAECMSTLRAVYQSARTREDEAESARVAVEERAAREREAAMKAQIAREERIAAEAAEVARVAAEAKAVRVAKETEERIAAQAAAAEALRKHQADEAHKAAIAAEERDRLAAKRLADTIEQAAAMKAHQIEQAEQERIAAIESERKRVAAQMAAQQAEDDRRAADKAHRGKTNREIVSDLIGLGVLREDGAKELVVALAKGQVRHLRIIY